MYSLIVPIYRNEKFIPKLITRLNDFNDKLNKKLEVIFVVDASPDNSFSILKKILPSQKFNSSLILLSRNFGSFYAIRAGLNEAKGKYFAVMSADLQEPSDLILKFFETLRNDSVDVVIGVRKGREESFFKKLSSNIFWFLYKNLIQHDMPLGGIDIFACNRDFCDQLIKLEELNSPLVGLVIWLGFRRKLINYTRKRREFGQSAWTLKKKFKYFADNIFSFTDLPVRILIGIGILGLSFSVLFSLFITFARISGLIEAPGYSATVIIISFFSGLNSFGLGIIGSYVWRAFENTKKRPLYVMMQKYKFSRRK